eukprot:gene423-784_t
MYRGAQNEEPGDPTLGDDSLVEPEEEDQALEHQQLVDPEADDANGLNDGSVKPGVCGWNIILLATGHMHSKAYQADDLRSRIASVARQEDLAKRIASRQGTTFEQELDELDFELGAHIQPAEQAEDGRILSGLDASAANANTFRRQDILLYTALVDARWVMRPKGSCPASEWQLLRDDWEWQPHACALRTFCAEEAAQCISSFEAVTVAGDSIAREDTARYSRISISDIGGMRRSNGQGCCHTPANQNYDGVPPRCDLCGWRMRGVRGMSGTINALVQLFDDVGSKAPPRMDHVLSKWDDARVRLWPFSAVLQRDVSWREIFPHKHASGTRQEARALK